MEEKKQSAAPEELTTAEPSGSAPTETPAPEIVGEQAEIPGMGGDPAVWLRPGSDEADQRLRNMRPIERRA